MHYRKEFVSVGVTKQENSFKQEIDENDTKLIWERILQYVPSLKVYTFSENCGELYKRQIGHCVPFVSPKKTENSMIFLLINLRHSRMQNFCGLGLV